MNTQESRKEIFEKIKQKCKNLYKRLIISAIMKIKPALPVRQRSL
jgi:hypothetical protein